MIPQLPPEVLHAAQALGLLNGDGSLNAGWFNDPSSRVRTVLSNPSQRSAFLKMLDAFAPPAAVPGAPAGEKWHPLLGEQPRGNLYLTVRNGTSPHVTVGLAGVMGAAAGAPSPSATLRARMPLARFAAGAEVIAGTPDGPLDVSLRVQLDWTRPAQPIALKAARVDVAVKTAGVDLLVHLEGLDLDGGGAKDRELRPGDLDSAALETIVGLLRQQLATLSGNAEASSAAAALPVLLGLSGGLPPLPLAQLADGPAALQSWLKALLATPASAKLWTEAFARLLGESVTATGSGTGEDPYRARLAALGSGAMNLTLAQSGGHAHVGFELAFAPGVPNSPAIRASATLAAVPLDGVADPRVLPAVSMLLVAEGSGGPLVDEAAFGASAVQAGVEWNGTHLRPVVVLTDVTLGGSTYERIDLTSADSVVAAASAGVQAAIEAALGDTGAGANLAALAGLVKPASDPDWPHLVEPATLVSQPTRAIGAVHRAALLDPVHGWSHLFAELADLVGATGPTTGSGTTEDPWRAPLSPESGLRLELAAWNAQTTPGGVPQQLRLGLRLAGEKGPWSFAWSSEVLAADLPAAGAGEVRLLAGQHAHLLIGAIPAVQAAAGVGLSAETFGVTLDWEPGSPMSLVGTVENLQVTAQGSTVQVPLLQFPQAVPIDIADPVGSLGVSAGDFGALVLGLMARASSNWSGSPGLVLTALLGVHRSLRGLPPEWPILEDHAGPGSMITDPLEALRAWFERLATTATLAGDPLLPYWMGAIRALLTNRVRDVSEAPPRSGAAGSGIYEDPWAVAVNRSESQPLELLSWIEPAGPPGSLATVWAGRVSGAASFVGALKAASGLNAFVPELREALAGTSPGPLGASLTFLSDFLARSDGVVPAASQLPDTAGWTTGALFDCAHDRQPAHASAISQVLAQVQSWTPTPAPRAVLLLAAPFADHSIWSPLLTVAPGTKAADAHFDLREPGVDPASIDLEVVGSVSDYYTADLQDRGDGDVPSLMAQIDRVVARIRQIRGGLPITLVAHSTTGLAARAWATANPALCSGLITLGTPHAGSPLTPLLEEEVARAVRFLSDSGLASAGAMPTAMQDALAHLTTALDGYRPGGQGQVPVPAPYPVANFAPPASNDAPAVPALAIGSVIQGNLLASFRTALADLAASVAASPPPAPTHVAFGLRARLATPQPGGEDAAVHAHLRADALRVALQPGAPTPARPERALSVDLAIERQDGWIAGGPVPYTTEGAPVTHRVRRAELGLTMVPTAGTTQCSPYVRLFGASFNGNGGARVEMDHAALEPLLGGLFAALSSHLAPGSGVAVFLDALEALSLAVPQPDGGFALSSDAFLAMRLDPGGFLLPRFGAALDLADGLLGFQGPFGGPYALPVAGGPFELVLHRAPQWTLAVRTKEPLSLAGAGELVSEAAYRWPGVAPSLDLSVQFGRLALGYSQSTGEVVLSAPPYFEALTLLPAPAPAIIATALNVAVPRLLISAATSAILEASIKAPVTIGPIDGLLGAPGATAQGSGLDGVRLAEMLEAIRLVGGFGPGPGLPLPGGVRLTASGTGQITLRLETTAPIGGVLSLLLDADIDSSMHMTPSGTATLSLGSLEGGWSGLELAFGVSAAGVSVSLTPDGQGAIQLLPTFSGLGALAGGMQSLLTSALDELDTALSASPPPWYTLSRDVAQALDLFDPVGRFQAHTGQWKALLQPFSLAAVPVGFQGQAASALAALFNGVSGAPTPAAANGGLVEWSFTPPGASGTLGARFGWTAQGPRMEIQVGHLKFGDGPVELTLDAGYAPAPGGDPVVCSLGLRFHLASSLGIGADPVLSFTKDGSTYSLELLPLGEGTGGTMSLRLAPQPDLIAGASAAAEFASKWMFPLLARVLIRPSDPRFSVPVWTGGKTAKELLKDAGLLNASFEVPATLPSVPAMLGGIAGSLAQAVPNISLTGTLKLGFASAEGRLGIRLRGHQDFQTGPFRIGVLFGEPTTLASDSDAGLALYVLQTPGFAFAPLLAAKGVGLSLGMEGGVPLVNTSVVRLGKMAGVVFFKVSLAPTFAFQGQFGAGIELEQVGIPLGQVVSGNLGGDNPVASSLLESGGSSGEVQAPAPTLDVTALYRNGTFSISFQGQTGGLWIPVQRAFGPIYIDQVGLELIKNSAEMALLVDGSVKVAGLTVQADDLGVVIPFRHLAAPAQWRLDLRGLAVAYAGDGISIAGGLIKYPGPPIRYDGMITVDVAGKGFTAVGSYARPTDAQGGYTSLFVFVSLPLTLGGPPCFFVTGLGGGAGFNRQLLPPQDIGEVPTFFLVRAIDDGGFANDPMKALAQLGDAVPSRRGSFWFAAGVRFDSFVLVHSVAVIYVALDRGFEIGLLGISRMALPHEKAAIANVELALKARFSSAEGVLSVQAQLTENSYILHPDCRLTGGFAFFIWFPKGQFVLTLGGYHPSFKAPKEFPVVPRLGFRWRAGPTVIKGEAYFALTNSCVMAGGRLEVSYGVSWAKAWCAAYADFLVSWDPFFYDIRIGVEIGVWADLGLFEIDVSIGADIHIYGPPLRADVTIDLEVVSFTISIGSGSPPKPNYIGSWSVFRDKYLTAGDSGGKAVGLRVTEGLLPTNPPGASPAPGSKAQPWQLRTEWAFLSETRMPAMSWTTFAASSGGELDDVAEIQIAPMNKLDITSEHTIQIFLGSSNAKPLIESECYRVQERIGLFPEATWRHSAKPKAAANTIRGVAGLELAGTAVPKGQSKLIRIMEMVDDLPSLALPLPFSTISSSYLDLLVSYGTLADALTLEVAGAPTTKMLDGALHILTGSGTPFAQFRSEAGIRASGLSPMAAHTLGSRRSAPPMVAPLTTGLTMMPVGLSLPPALHVVPEIVPLRLERHRLAAVLQGATAVTADAPIALHTTCLDVSFPAAPRMAPPFSVSLVGARLRRLAGLNAPRPTRAAVAPRTLLHPSTGVASAPLHARLFEEAAEKLYGEGVVVPAGTTHVWELAAETGESLYLGGTSAARVVFMNNGGSPLFDSEFAGKEKTEIPIPRKAASVAVTCLGVPPSREWQVSGFGAVTMALGPARRISGVGWESADVREQVGSSTILGRGATLILGRPHHTFHRDTKTAYAMVNIAEVVREQEGLETRLPRRVTSVMILLDVHDSCAADEGDFAVAADGATLVTPGIPVGGGRRRAILYGVLPDTRGGKEGGTEPRESRDYFSVSVASRQGWRVAGVIGLAGPVIEWAARLHAGLPEDLAPNGPLTPHGSVRVSVGKPGFASEQGTRTATYATPPLSTQASP